MSRAFKLCGLMLLALARLASAEDSVTLPLEGYFHPGRYMPVHVVAEPAGGRGNAIVVKGEETVWATVNSRKGEKIDGVVPVMPIRAEPSILWWGWLSQHGHDIRPTLRPLTNRQKLIGFVNGPISASDAIRVAKQVYPDGEFIPEALNAAQPLPGAPACWEALDLVALDDSSAAQIGEHRLSTLVAAGVAFAVHAPQPPWPHWPWKQGASGWWILHYVPAGPTTAVYNADVYAPVSNFTAGWPATMRWRYFLDGVGSSLLMLLLAILRPRYTAVWGVLIIGGFCTFILYWHQWERPLRVAEGKIRVIGTDITQDDDWAYFTAPERTYSRNRWVDTMQIVIASPGLLSDMNARVECLSNGDPDALAFDVLPHAKVAVLCRRCGPQPPAILPSSSTHSPMERLVKNVYLQSGGEILGELRSAPLVSEGYFHLEQWPAVVVKQAK